MAGNTARFRNSIEGLEEIATRLLRVQIENRPAIECIKLYDAHGGLIFADPPYVHSTRGDSAAYGIEMTDTEHEELADCLNDCKGMVALCGYNSELYDRLYPSPRWQKHVHTVMAHSVKQEREEVLWTNYKVDTSDGLL